jgi:hypothetical protein
VPRFYVLARLVYSGDPAKAPTIVRNDRATKEANERVDRNDLLDLAVRQAPKHGSVPVLVADRASASARATDAENNAVRHRRATQRPARSPA